jgi:hypothetical protein
MKKTDLQVQTLELKNTDIGTCLQLLDFRPASWQKNTPKGRAVASITLYLDYIDVSRYLTREDVEAMRDWLSELLAAHERSESHE